MAFKDTEQVAQELSQQLGQAKLPIARKWFKNPSLVLMALPGIIVLVVFAYIPMFGIIIAFKDYRPIDGIFGSRWVGLDNFGFLFGSNAAWHITFNTLFMNIIFIVTTTIAGLGLALMLNEIRDSSKFWGGIYQGVLFF